MPAKLLCGKLSRELQLKNNNPFGFLQTFRRAFCPVAAHAWHQLMRRNFREKCLALYIARSVLDRFVSIFMLHMCGAIDKLTNHFCRCISDAVMFRGKLNRTKFRCFRSAVKMWRYRSRTNYREATTDLWYVYVQRWWKTKNRR